MDLRQVLETLAARLESRADWGYDPTYGNTESERAKAEALRDVVDEIRSVLGEFEEEATE